MKSDYSEQEIADLQAELDAQPLDVDTLKAAFDPLLGPTEPPLPFVLYEKTQP